MWLVVTIVDSSAEIPQSTKYMKSDLVSVKLGLSQDHTGLALFPPESQAIDLKGHTPRSLQTFSVKGQVVNILGFVGQQAKRSLLQLFNPTIVTQKQSQSVKELQSCVQIKHLFTNTEIRISYNYHVLQNITILDFFPTI